MMSAWKIAGLAFLASGVVAGQLIKAPPGAPVAEQHAALGKAAGVQLLATVIAFVWAKSRRGA